MSVGGIITKIVEKDDSYAIEVTDNKDVQWRSLEKNEITKCIGTGDAIWWQSHKAYWTPSSLRKKSWEKGKSDFDVGKCYGIREPEDINPLSGLKQEDHSNDDLNLPHTY